MGIGGDSGGGSGAWAEKFALSLVAGGGAGAISKTCIAPLERIKILLQVQTMQQSPHGQVYSGIGDALRGIYRNEGARAYWKGNYANCVRIVPVCALKFTFFDNLKTLMLPHGHNYTGFELWARKVAAGGLSGALMLVCVYPLEVVRTRLTANQARHKKDAHFKGVWDCMTKTVHKEGARSLYKGLAPSLLGIIPYLGLMFSTYDTIRMYTPTGPDGKHSTASTLFIGGMSGLFAQTAVFPIDTVRNRMQVDGLLGNDRKYTSTWNCFQTIYRQEGVKAFYRGVTTNMYKGFPGIAIEFYCYDRLKNLFFAVVGETDSAGKL